LYVKLPDDKRNSSDGEEGCKPKENKFCKITTCAFTRGVSCVSNVLNFHARLQLQIQSVMVSVSVFPGKDF